MSNTFKQGCDTACTPLQTHSYQQQNGVVRFGDNVIAPSLGVTQITVPVYSIMLGCFAITTPNAVIDNAFPSFNTGWSGLTLGVGNLCLVDNSAGGGIQQYNFLEYQIDMLTKADPANTNSLFKVTSLINSLGFVPCEQFKMTGIFDPNKFDQMRNLTVQNTDVVNYTLRYVYMDFSWLFRGATN